MNKKDIKEFKEVNKRLAVVFNILKAHKNGTATDKYEDSLEHAECQVLIAECDVSHQIFLTERRRWSK